MLPAPAWSTIADVAPAQISDGADNKIVGRRGSNPHLGPSARPLSLESCDNNSCMGMLRDSRGSST